MMSPDLLVSCAVRARREDVGDGAAEVGTEFDPGGEHELHGAGHAAILVLVVRRGRGILREQPLVLAGHAELEPAEVVDERRAAAEAVEHAVVAPLGEELEAEAGQRIKVQGDVHRALRTVVEVARQVRLRDRAGPERVVVGADALVGVEVQAHAEVVDGERLEPADGDVPAFPDAGPDPQVVGTRYVRLEVQLSEVGDELRLGLREPVAVRVGRGNAQVEAPLPEQLGRVIGLARVADARALVVGVDPAVARDADADARIVRPLVALHVQPEGAAVKAAGHRLGVGGRRQPFDEAGGEVGLRARRRRRRVCWWLGDVRLRHRGRRSPLGERIGPGRAPAARQRRRAENDDRDEGGTEKGGEELFCLRARMVGVVVL